MRPTHLLSVCNLPLESHLQGVLWENSSTHEDPLIHLDIFGNPSYIVSHDLIVFVSPLRIRMLYLARQQRVLYSSALTVKYRQVPCYFLSVPCGLQKTCACQMPGKLVGISRLFRINRQIKFSCTPGYSYVSPSTHQPLLLQGSFVV